MSPVLAATPRSLDELLSPQTYGSTGPDLRGVFNESLRCERHYYAPVSITRQQEVWELIFRTLRDEWLEDTKFVSSVTDMIAHPAYQTIIAVGIPLIPFLLKELQIQPQHWFAALNAITGADPVRPQERGNVPAMIQAWLRWGRSKGLI